MFRRLLHILVSITLGVTLGSLIFFGMGVAGTIFREGILPSRTLAGALNGEILHQLVILVAVATTLAVGSVLYLFLSSRAGSRWFGLITSICIVGTCGIALYSGFVMFPEVNALRQEIGNFDSVLPSKQEAHDQFSNLHSKFSLLTKIELVLAFFGIIFHTLWMTVPLPSVKERSDKKEKEEKNLPERQPTSAMSPSPVAPKEKVEAKKGRKEEQVPPQEKKEVIDVEAEKSHH